MYAEKEFRDFWAAIFEIPLKVLLQAYISVVG
jgi:hypothetical protein